MITRLLFVLTPLCIQNAGHIDGGKLARSSVRQRDFRMKEYGFELCAETLTAARAAELGGADSVELCARLDLGGITPSERLTAAAVQVLSIPVHVLIRPRGGDFAYTADEYDLMRRQVQWARQAGAAGIVIGVLQADGQVDVGRSRELVELARPLKATFHRAFDETPDLFQALEAVIATGADCLLTSGGAPEVLVGAEQILRLIEQAGERIQIMAGGGLRLSTMAQVLGRTGVRFLHGSLTRRKEHGHRENVPPHTAAGEADLLVSDVRTAVRLLHEHFALEKI